MMTTTIKSELTYFFFFTVKGLWIYLPTSRVWSCVKCCKKSWVIGETKDVDLCCHDNYQTATLTYYKYYYTGHFTKIKRQLKKKPVVEFTYLSFLILTPTTLLGKPIS